MNPDQLHFRLYVAGESPNSKLAIANLKALCDKYFPHSPEAEVIDVFEDPSAALRDGVMVTPLLCVTSGSSVQRLIGDLKKTAAVLESLGVKVESP